MTRLVASLGALVLLFGVSTAYAARGPASMSSASSFYNKKPTKYEFKDDVIEAEKGGPGSSFVDPTVHPRPPSLIALRANFVPEMLKAAEDL